MAQADQTVQNNTFPTVRADINNNLAALFSKNSGAAAPSTTVAFMDWIDTSGANPIWKKRNAANNAWITLGTIVSNTIAFEGTLPSQSGNSGKYLTTDGSVASWASVTSGGQLLRAPQILTSGTTYTTPADCTKIYVECVGGGGGGGGRNSAASAVFGGGGGSGAYAAKLFTVTASTAYTYAIGAGGAGASAGGAGGAAGSTTFTVGGTTITAGGGAGGGPTVYLFNVLYDGAGGAGGTATNGDININGAGGGSSGGASFFGGGARQAGANDSSPFAGSSGGGGSGGARIFTTGGAGGNGLIRIWEYS